MVQSSELIFLLLIAFIYLVPFFSILFSSRTRGSEKLAWIIAVTFISWFAWIIYLLIAPVKKRN